MLGVGFREPPLAHDSMECLDITMDRYLLSHPVAGKVAERM